MSLDSKQLLIKNELDKLALNLEQQSSANIFKKILSSKQNPKSLYIYGGVGRGKTMLMRGFFESLHKTPKLYIHFNSFMRSIHEALRDIRLEKKKYKDELIEATNRVVANEAMKSLRMHESPPGGGIGGFLKKTNHPAIVCFDEFQVTDIADAMLLARIFSYLFSIGVVAVFTSNTEPLELYKDGLQREVFLDFVKNILLKNAKVLHLDSETDYRAKRKAGVTKRYLVSNKKNRDEFKKIIAEFTDGKPLKRKKIKVWGREIILKKTHEKILVTTFEELCMQPFAASDYQEICKNFDLIFLKGLPIFTRDERNEMRRFMLFIDEVYEHKTGLIILAKTTIKNLCDDNLFKRTASRLREIKSDEYWA
jgi:cell division protein ZapE